jgi:hypothetical protein
MDRSFYVMLFTYIYIHTNICHFHVKANKTLNQNSFMVNLTHVGIIYPWVAIILTCVVHTKTLNVTNVWFFIF